jgi:adenine phosphoribosyltransferase
MQCRRSDQTAFFVWSNTDQPKMDHLRTKIRHVPDFPKPGILFYDITTLLSDAQGFSDVIGALAAPFAHEKIDHVVGIESRGFILGAAVANQLRTGFVPIRKPGKLPSKTHREDYALEYGFDGLEIHQDAVSNGQRVLIVDDVLATGGTAKAAAALVRRIGGVVVGVAFLIELTALQGRGKLAGEAMYSVLQY